MTSTIVWRTKSTLDRITARAASRMKATLAFGTTKSKRLSLDEFLALERGRPAEIVIELRRHEAFHDVYETPLKSERDLQKLFINEVSRVSPLSDCDVTVLPIKSIRPGALSVLQMRTQTLRDLEDHALSIGASKITLSAEDQLDERFEIPLQIRQSRLSRSISAIAMGLFLCGAWIGSSSLANQRENIAEQWALQELALRRQVSSLNEISAEAQAYENFSQLRPVQTSPQGTLERLARLTEATPNSAWWTKVSLSAGVLQVSAVSADAGSTLQSISEAFADHTVEFEGSVSELRDGKQSFTLEIREVADDD